MPNLQLMKNMLTLRKYHNITQELLAQKLNISRQAYSNYEKGKRNPDLDTLLYLSNLYEVSLDDFVKRNIQPGQAIQDCKMNRKRLLTVSDFNQKKTIYVSEHELDIILRYRNLTPEQQASFDAFLMAQPRDLNKNSGRSG